jgi:hypothetical protein
MTDKYTVPPPVLLNSLKHHLGYIKDFIERSAAVNNIEEVTRQLLLIGESQMDLYLGDLTPEIIAYQITKQLQEKGAIDKEQYLNFINNQDTSYQIIRLSDNSVWVLRLGEKAERYIHIHPGRYSPHTVRVKAGALKTTIAASVWMKMLNQAVLTLELLNYVRKEILGESPVKSLEATEGFGKLFKLVHPERIR